MDDILIDECLSPALVGVAMARGHAATHVTWIAGQGKPDWNIVDLIGQRDFVFVTNNRRDFLRYYAELDIHSGLIIIVPNTARANQIRLFRIGLDVAEQQDDLINRLIEVHQDGTAGIRDWSHGGGATTV